MKKYSILILTLSFFVFLFLFAQEKDTIQFSHEYHVLEEEMACADCHNAAESNMGSDNLLPAMETCADCHDVDDDSNCNQCHSNIEEPDEAMRVVSYSPLFSHEKHLAAELECASCHGEVDGIGIGMHLTMPDMVACMDCHDQKSALNDCSTCHGPNDRLKPLNHDLSFINTHGNLAENMTSDAHMNKDCATCHKTQFCQDCHEGENIDRLAHPLNFEFTHALSAQGKERNCFTCHENREFCSSCHDSYNFERPHNHTANWTNTIDGGSHRIEATIDLESCMNCHEHEAEQKCQPCHTN